MHYLSETRVVPLTNVRRERLLPQPGRILVNSGDEVAPTQVVGRTGLPSDFRIVPVGRLLDIPPSRVKRCLTIDLGDEVRQGQVIAKQRRLLGRSARSPIDGMVTASGGGRILIEASPTPFELRAYISGTVSNVMGDRGVVVETKGAVIEGAWGTGGESVGVLNSMVRSPDRPLRGQAINPSCHGTILIGGSNLNERGLERAQEIEIAGIVTGGLPPELLPLVGELDFPVIATEGIGGIPMARPIFELLNTHEGREASLNGRARRHWDSVRPEIVIPLPAEEVPSTQSQPGTPLTVGAQVRAVRAPFAGAVGTVVDLPDYDHRIETGARIACAEVDLDQEGAVFIPLVNLEILR